MKLSTRLISAFEAQKQDLSKMRTQEIEQSKSELAR
jgi:hypothetical protein